MAKRGKRLIIAARYSFNNGDELVRKRYPHLLSEIEETIAAVNAELHCVKKSKEKTMMGRMLYCPGSLNKTIKNRLHDLGWKKHRIDVKYSGEYYTPEYLGKVYNAQGSREMDFLKEKLGVEVQFGKYSFMTYDVAAKMPIFRNRRVIDTGIEIVPVKRLTKLMSSGVSHFEQFIWDLKERGVADVDVPVLILGIDSGLPDNEKRPQGQQIALL